MATPCRITTNSLVQIRLNSVRIAPDDQSDRAKQLRAFFHAALAVTKYRKTSERIQRYKKKTIYHDHFIITYPEGQHSTVSLVAEEREMEGQSRAILGISFQKPQENDRCVFRAWHKAGVYYFYAKGQTIKLPQETPWGRAIVDEAARLPQPSAPSVTRPPAKALEWFAGMLCKVLNIKHER